MIIRRKWLRATFVEQDESLSLIIRPHRSTTSRYRCDLLLQTEQHRLSVGRSVTTVNPAKPLKRSTCRVGDSGGSTEACIRRRCIHLCHLPNTIEPSMRGGDAAFSSNYFGHLLVIHLDLLLRKGCEVLQSACLYVCLCLSARVSQEPHVQTLLNFLSVLLVAVARSSSDDIAVRYALPVLWMMSYFQ